MRILETRDPRHADGLLMDCPCGDGGSLLVWFVGVPPDVSPGPGRWHPVGSLDRLTLEASSS